MRKKLQKTIFAAILCMALLQVSYGQVPTFSPALHPSDGVWNKMSRKADPGKTEYLYDPAFLEAVFYGADNKPVAGQKFKLNLKTGKVFFPDENNENMEVVTPVKKIEFLPHEGESHTVVFERGFVPAENTFYQVAVAGKASLLIECKFVDVEEYVFGGTNNIRTDKVKTFYGTNGTAAVKLEKNENLLTLFGDKNNEMTEYIRKEKIKIKKQEDLEKVFTYYNSLSK